MTQNADASTIREFLQRVRNRLATVAVFEGAAVGFGLVALLVLVRWRAPLSMLTWLVLGMTVIGAAVVARLFMSAALRRQAASAVERVTPRCHNLLVTAHEILVRPDSARTPIASLVFRQAATVAKSLDIAQLFPLKRAGLMAGGGVVLVGLLLTAHNTGTATQLGKKLGVVGATGEIANLTVTVEAPAYAARPAQTLTNPGRIEALAGSRVTLRVLSDAATISLETLDGTQPLVRGENGQWTGTVSVVADGFIAVQPTVDSKPGTRKLIGLSVTPDQPPRVRLTAPGKDLMFPDGNRSLGLSVEADDDLALATLKLRYTKVSGSGERFTFSEGEVPLNVTRSSDASWKAHATWNLRELNLEPGDMVVYRAVAADRRPGAVATESDSYITEILAPGSEAAAGFAIDPDQDRYALSQQMIIVKTERLVAKRASMSAEQFADEASEIALEQRRVRAEFIFMMGGELEDAPAPEADMTMLNETEEAEAEADILDGRGANLGRIALGRAVRAMSNAAAMLIQVNVADALSRERVALAELERAFSHTRIILRALTQQERLDMTRRMTGPLLETGRDVHPVPSPQATARVVALRKALADIAAMTGAAESTVALSAQSSALAETVLRVEASSKSLQAIAAALNDAAAAFGKSRVPEAVHALEAAAVSLTAVLRAESPGAPNDAPSFRADQLRGAFTDALRAAQIRR